LKDAVLIQADVVDIAADSPKPSDVFLVDTNVWFWTAYSKASITKSYRATYASYLTKALAAGSRLYVSGLSQAELIHVIEKAEMELFGKTKELKEFRYNFPAQRTMVVSEATTAWSVVQNMAVTVDVLVDDDMHKRTLARLSTCTMDAYDLISAEVMFEEGIPQVLTSDMDFASVPGITLFTANQRVLLAAQSDKKLLVR
jgi:predicted nucleic acid-binding protein